MSEESKPIAAGGASPVCEICGRERSLAACWGGTVQCYQIAYDRARASLSTAEKALAEKTFEHRPDQVLRRQVERAEKAETALEKALGALREYGDHTSICNVHSRIQTACSCGFDEALRGLAEDALKAPKDE